MHRFYIPAEQCSGDLIQLTDDEAHHATRVLRIATGESVVVLDGVGHTMDCDVREVTKRSVTLSVMAISVHSATSQYGGSQATGWPLG